jgi:hypothetical protein
MIHHMIRRILSRLFRHHQQGTGSEASIANQITVTGSSGPRDVTAKSGELEVECLTPFLSHGDAHDQEQE